MSTSLINKEELDARLRQFYEQRGFTATDDQIHQDIEGIVFDVNVAIANGEDPLEAHNEWFARRVDNLVYVEKLAES